MTSAMQAPLPPTVSPTYLDAYDRVGRPRLLVLIDRSDPSAASLLDGDLELVERVVRESLAAGGQVAIIPADAVSDRVNKQQIADALAGRGNALADVGASLRADVLIDLKLSSADGQTQIIATARNTRDAQKIATAVASVAPQSARRQIDFAARLLGERMVDTLADVWDRIARQGPATQPNEPQGGKA
jgi:hypothetical protein